MATDIGKSARLHSVAPLPRFETEPPPSFLLRTVRVAAQPTSNTQRRWRATVLAQWIALGVALVIIVGAATGYWLFEAAQKQVPAEVAMPLQASPTVLPATETAPTFSAPRLARGLPSPDIQLLPNEATAPPAPPVAARNQSPTAVSSLPSTTEQKPPIAAAVEAPQGPATELPSNEVFVVRFDSKLPGLTPTGLRVLDAALRASRASRDVRISIEGCDRRDNAPNGVDCAALTHRLKRILADRGIHQPDALIVAVTYP